MGWETDELVLRDLKQLKEELKQCCRRAHASTVNNNDEDPLDVDEFRQKYGQALKGAIEQTPPSTKTDVLKNVKEYNLKLKQMIEEKEELNVHEKGVLNEAEATVKRLEDRIKMVQEALEESEKQGRAGQKKITQEHVASVRQKFLELRNVMNRTINAHFGIHASDVRATLQELMKAKSDDAYIRITSSNFATIRFLKDKNIVAPNPYDVDEVKIVF